MHCTGTTKKSKVEAIKVYWRKFLGWKNPGYHYLVDTKGNVHNLLPEEEVANGVRGHNHESIHVGYIGGATAHGNYTDTRTAAQKRVLWALLFSIKIKHPFATIQGHRDFASANKVCPCFDAKKEYANIYDFSHAPKA